MASQREKTNGPLCSIASAGQELGIIASSLSAGRRRHDHRVVMVMMAMGQRGLHNGSIIGACDKGCQRLFVKKSLRPNAVAKRI